MTAPVRVASFSLGGGEPGVKPVKSAPVKSAPVQSASESPSPASFSPLNTAPCRFDPASEAPFRPRTPRKSQCERSTPAPPTVMPVRSTPRKLNPLAPRLTAMIDKMLACPHPNALKRAACAMSPSMPYRALQPATLFGTGLMAT